MSRAALLTRLHAPLEIVDLEPLHLSYGQVLVEVYCSGICGAQLQEIDGAKPCGPLPHPLGHEGCGLVEAVGPGVTRLKVNDKVVMHWRKGEGIEADFGRYQLDGRTITGGRVTTFGQHMICSENRLTAVSHNVNHVFCALLGCSLSTALATIEYEAKVGFGETVLVVGCGGLGLSLIMAARMRHAAGIVGADIRPEKGLMAMEMGASMFVLPPDWGNLGFDVIINTTGSAESIEQSLPALAPGGRYILVGQPAPSVGVLISNARHLFEGDGKSLTATQGGRFNPTRDIPRYVAMYNDGAFADFFGDEGKFDSARWITQECELRDINAGIEAVRSGLAGRILVNMSL